MEKYLDRIAFRGDLGIVLADVCAYYDLGSFRDYEIITLGYEDFNLFLQTSRGRYFIKVFADFRSLEECQRYIEITQTAMKAGISVPNIFSGNDGYLFRKKYQNYEFRLSAGEYLEGQNLHQSGHSLTTGDKTFLIQQAAKINQIDLKPQAIYDSWAITSLPLEFAKKSRYLDGRCKEAIGEISEHISALENDKLPHSFVHGDIISTNVVRTNKDGKLFIVDFSVANYYPRIVELAVLFCDLLYVPAQDYAKNPNYQLAITQYQKIQPLTRQELEALPLFLQAAHAMHILNGTYYREAEGDGSEENSHWINLGKQGLGLE